MIKVGVLGAKGRMGSQACATVEAASDLELAAQVDVGDPITALEGCDVVVDFTHPGAVMENLRWCVEHGVARRGRDLGLQRRPGSTRCASGWATPAAAGCWSCPTSRSAPC